MEHKIRVDSLVKRFGEKRVVDNVGFDVAPGEFVVILGPSGCGKTTTLRMLAGLETPDEGSIAVDGRTVTNPAQNVFVRPEHRDIGMVFQSYAIWPHLTVFENVAFPLHVRNLPRDTITSKVSQVLQLVGLKGEADRSATALSGGQMQRVALARALVFDPKLLLFDEPLSNLDLKLREHLRGELKRLHRETKLTSIYVTHDQAEAVELADRVIVMQHGRIVQSGAPETLYRRPNSRFVAEFIATANIIDGHVEELVGASTARVGTDNGVSLIATFEQPVSTGESVSVVVHPEDCEIQPANGGAPGISARVVDRQFQGTSTRYVLDFGGGDFDVIVLGTYANFVPGAEVKLKIDPQRATVIAKSAA